MRTVFSIIVSISVITAMLTIIFWSIISITVTITILSILVIISIVLSIIVILITIFTVIIDWALKESGLYSPRAPYNCAFACFFLGGFVGRERFLSPDAFREGGERTPRHSAEYVKIRSASDTLIICRGPGTGSLVSCSHDRRSIGSVEALERLMWLSQQQYGEARVLNADEHIRPALSTTSRVFQQ